MRCLSDVKVVLSKNAYCQIKDSVNDANNNFEVGGVLLGYKILTCYFVVAATVPTESAEKSRVSFTLDGDWHTAHALELMRKFRYEPSILGIWHSHICDLDTFSEQDRQSNKQIATSLNGALSMLVMLMVPQQKLSLTTYFISPSGEEKRCSTIITRTNQNGIKKITRR